MDRYISSSALTPGYLSTAQYNCTERLFAHRSVGYLDLNNVHKMIRRFILEKRMSKVELARGLEITVKSLDHLLSYNIPAGLLAKINLPLARLYCETKW